MKRAIISVRFWHTHLTLKRVHPSRNQSWNPQFHTFHRIRDHVISTPEVTYSPAQRPEISQALPNEPVLLKDARFGLICIYQPLDGGKTLSDMKSIMSSYEGWRRIDTDIIDQYGRRVFYVFFRNPRLMNAALSRLSNEHSELSAFICLRWKHNRGLELRPIDLLNQHSTRFTAADILSSAAKICGPVDQLPGFERMSFRPGRGLTIVFDSLRAASDAMVKLDGRASNSLSPPPFAVTYSSLFQTPAESLQLPSSTLFIHGTINEKYPSLYEDVHKLSKNLGASMVHTSPILGPKNRFKVYITFSSSVEAMAASERISNETLVSQPHIAMVNIEKKMFVRKSPWSPLPHEYTRNISIEGNTETMSIFKNAYSIVKNLKGYEWGKLDLAKKPRRTEHRVIARFASTEDAHAALTTMADLQFRVRFLQDKKPRPESRPIETPKTVPSSTSTSNSL